MATFHIRRSRDYVAVEAVQNKTTRGESALEVSRARAKNDWGRCGSNQGLGAEEWERFACANR